MAGSQRSILLLGESNVGKTHYGAQVLKRLIVGRSSLKMFGQATNLGPFEQAMDCLADGRATGHTPSKTYDESVWPVVDARGNRAELIWPDYGGEQIKNLIADHRIAVAWRDRVLLATDWILLVRLHILKHDADIFSRPLAELGKTSTPPAERKPSDQARLVELLQMLLHVAPVSRDMPIGVPSLTILLSCWDEVEAKTSPREALRSSLPLFSDFVESVWERPTVVGLSALERPLSEEQSDIDYATRGPETFGYIVQPEGSENHDITWPITRLIGGT
ncbi:MAG: hypothetical protein J0J01_18310 [Reyranella sp.]|uniref:TRAFAC clade GTPase domain-containing protein n=1 Tax=Reyranella sp. TaxID=1929291 RepID=UPI001ACA7D4B|nr:hypothetical protein [Reyranella sp.]MBN9088864.1 hypothetical protein [Reyranella sp.]